MKNSDVPFPQALQALMVHRGETYRGLAAEAGLSAGYLNHLAHGNRPVPSDDVIDRLAWALNVPPAHFREWRARRVLEALERDARLLNRLYKTHG